MADGRSISIYSLILFVRYSFHFFVTVWLFSAAPHGRETDAILVLR